MTERAVGALLLVERRVAQPDVEHRIAAIDPEFQPLIGIVGADRHQVAPSAVALLLARTLRMAASPIERRPAVRLKV